MSQIESSGAIGLGVLAVIAGVLAWYMEGWSLALRYVLAGVALVFGSVWLVWLVRLVLYIGIAAFADLEAAKLAPQIRLMREVRLLSPDQLRAVIRQDISLAMIASAGVLHKKWITPSGDLDHRDVSELTRELIRSREFPNLPILWGLPDNSERRFLSQYIRLMIDLGLADRPGGPQKPARFIRSRQEIMQILEVPHDK